MEIASLIEKANLKIPKENIKFNEPMNKHTSFKVGGVVDCYIRINDVQELKQILNFTLENKIPFFILGNGSNVLVTDKGVRGIVIQINIKKFEIIDNNELDKSEDLQIIRREKMNKDKKYIKR